MRTRSRLDRLGAQALALLAPPACPACGRPACGRAWDGLCPACRPKLTPRPLCRRCGRALPGTQVPAGAGLGECRVCRRLHPRFDAARAVATYHGTWKQAVKAFKSRPAGDLLAGMAGLLRRLTRSRRLPGAWRGVVPIPARRRSDRHPAEFLARALAKRAGLDYLPVLRFSRRTRAQRGLRRRERLLNLAGALACRSSRVRGLDLLIVDDVLTTGATVNEAARALRRAGAARLGVLTLARGADL